MSDADRKKLDDNLRILGNDVLRGVGLLPASELRALISAAAEQFGGFSAVGARAEDGDATAFLLTVGAAYCELVAQQQDALEDPGTRSN